MYLYGQLVTNRIRRHLVGHPVACLFCIGRRALNDKQALGIISTSGTYCIDEYLLVFHERCDNCLLIYIWLVKTCKNQMFVIILKLFGNLSPNGFQNCFVSGLCSPSSINIFF